MNKVLTNTFHRFKEELYQNEGRQNDFFFNVKTNFKVFFFYGLMQVLMKIAKKDHLL